MFSSVLLWGLAACSSLAEKDANTALCHGIDVRELTISQVHVHYADGVLTPAKLTECYLNRIRAMNPFLAAVVATNPGALASAVQLQDASSRGPLYGIPVLVKDNIAVDGMQTTAGSYALLDMFPKEEALVVGRLREQGAIILGKANLSELSG